MGGHSGSRTAATTPFLRLHGAHYALTYAQAQLVWECERAPDRTVYAKGARLRTMHKLHALGFGMEVQGGERDGHPPNGFRLGSEARLFNYRPRIVGEKTIGTAPPPHAVKPRLVGEQVERFNQLWGIGPAPSRDDADREYEQASRQPALACPAPAVPDRYTAGVADASRWVSQEAKALVMLGARLPAGSRLREALSALDKAYGASTVMPAASLPAPAPTVHLNGSGLENLTRDYERIEAALHEGLSAIMAAWPHGRDYYVQADPEALTKAQAAMQSRYDRVRDVLNEIKSLHETVVNSVPGRTP